MFNFTGQTKRRNVNLGNKSRNTKQDLLKNAKLEREKRALEKQKNEAIVLIQSKIRTLIIRRKLISHFVNQISHNGEEDNICYQLLTVFGVSLYNTLPTDIFNTILSRASNASILQPQYIQYYNEIVFEVLRHCKIEDDLTATLLLNSISSLNVSNLTNLFDSYIEYISKVELATSSDSYIQSFVDLLLKYPFIKLEPQFIAFWSIDSTAPRNRINKNVYDKIIIYLSRNQLIPDLMNYKGNSLGDDQDSLIQLLINMCFGCTNSTNEIQKDFYMNLIICLTPLQNQNFANHPFLYNRLYDTLQILIDSKFLSFLVNIIVNESHNLYYGSLITLINLSPDVDSKNSLLINLLSDKRLFYIINKKIIDQDNDLNLSLKSHHDFQFEPILLLFIEFLNLKLVLLTDHELLYQEEKSGINIENLMHFTVNLKDLVFKSLWEDKEEYWLNKLDNTLYSSKKAKVFEVALPLLKKIYLRDSRLHFLTGTNTSEVKNKKNFWNINDSEFLKINIYKNIIDYENMYRSYMDKVDEEEIEEDSNKRKDNIVDKFTEMQNNILLRLNQNIKRPTKQFKKMVILLKAPFFVPFHERVDLFYLLIAMDKKRLGLDDDSFDFASFMWGTNQINRNRQTATISRSSMLEDAYNSYNKIGERFKAKLSITFVNEFGEVEAGIDGGGITKEFLTSVCDVAFNDHEKYQYFIENENHELYPNDKFSDNSDILRFYWFLGKILGKCLYEHVSVDVQFANFFLKKILNYDNKFHSTLDDLSSYDPSLYHNLVKLLEMNEEDINSMGITFSINVGDDNKQIELIPNGSNIQVTKKNILRYVMEYAEFKLNRQLNKQTSYFHGGMCIIIAPHWMDMFNSTELQKLISGEGKDIDLEDLKKNTEYGGYEQSSTTITYLWEILEEMKSQERLDFIKFVTSVPRAPLQGFGALEPKFGIRNAGDEIENLPTASTCVNLLKLPDYQDKELLKRKLIYAIHAGAGFDLS